MHSFSNLSNKRIITIPIRTLNRSMINPLVIKVMEEEEIKEISLVAKEIEFSVRSAANMDMMPPFATTGLIQIISQCRCLLVINNLHHNSTCHNLNSPFLSRQSSNNSGSHSRILGSFSLGLLCHLLGHLWPT